MSIIAPDVRSEAPLPDDKGMVVRPIQTIPSATEETLIALRAVTEELRKTSEIIKYLASIIADPLWVEPITSRVKTDTSIVGGTLAGITNIATIGGGAAKDAIIDPLWSNDWANSIRSRIT